MEDLLRAYQFNLEDIRQYVVAHYPISDEEKEETLKWFADLIQKMNDENILHAGHLKEVQQEVDRLAEIHWRLLKEDPAYFEIYSKAKPYVFQFILEAGEQHSGHEIQICFNTIYGYLLAKLNGRGIPEDVVAAVDTFGDVLSYLNLVLNFDLESKIRNN
jgi:hypothetical protein